MTEEPEAPGFDDPGAPGLVDARGPEDRPEVDVTGLVGRLAAAGMTVAVAESLTGGRVLAALTSVPGASSVIRGGVVAYATDVKSSVLGVGPDLIARVGPASPQVALEMASGCRGLLGATFGVSTTGEAGPTAATAVPVGTFFVAIDGPGGRRVAQGSSRGGREQVRAEAVAAALALLDAECGAREQPRHV